MLESRRFELGSDSVLLFLSEETLNCLSLGFLVHKGIIIISVSLGFFCDLNE